MAKWINTATGLEVPTSEVREMVPGSGIFVHEATVTTTSIKVTRAGGPRRPVPASFELVGPSSTKIIDGYAVKIADDATYDAEVNTVSAQALASQTALRARRGV